MPALHYYSGAWSAPVNKLYYWSGGWVPVKNAYYWSGGWVKFFAAQAVEIGNLSPFKLSTSPTDAVAGYRIHADGSIDVTESTSLSWNEDGGQWLINGAANEFEVMASGLTGDALTAGSSALNTWINCSTSPFWYQSVTGIDTKNSSFTVQIRDVATHTVLDSATVSLGADVESGA